MAGLGSVIPGLLSAGTNIAATQQRSSAAAADARLAQRELDDRRLREAEAAAYQRQQDELRLQREAEAEAYQRQQEAARLAAEKEAEDRRYNESKAAEERRLAAEQAAREYQAQLAREAEQRAWERDERLRQEELTRKAAEQEAARLEAENQRRLAMDILANAQNNEYQQLLNRQNEDWGAAATAADVQRTQIQETSSVAEAERRAALKRTQATARARLGANGVGVDDGSGRAVLLGQQAATDAETAAQAKIDQLRLQTIQADLDNRRRVNLLAQAELAERQRIEYLNKFYG